MIDLKFRGSRAIIRFTFSPPQRERSLLFAQGPLNFRTGSERYLMLWICWLTEVLHPCCYHEVGVFLCQSGNTQIYGTDMALEHRHKICVVVYVLLKSDHPCFRNHSIWHVDDVKMPSQPVTSLSHWYYFPLSRHWYLLVTIIVCSCWIRSFPAGLVYMQARKKLSMKSQLFLDDNCWRGIRIAMKLG